MAQLPNLLGYEKPTGNRADEVTFESKAGHYYVLRAGNTVTQITDAVGMMIGSGNTDTIISPPPFFEAPTGFFVVEEVPINSPLDIDNDGIGDPFELNHPIALNPFDPSDGEEDFDGDGMASLQEYLEGFNPEIPDSYFLKGLSPAAGETKVSLTRETILRFHGEIVPATLTTNSFYLLAGSERVPGRVVVSSTRRFATFFYDQPLAASTEFRIVVDGDTIQLANGSLFDGDEDGTPGGVGYFDFRSLPITRIPNTSVFGFVKDSNTGAPLAGVTIRVDAFPAANVVTDASGRFELMDMPAPDFFVHIDGSTASAPSGFTYPNVGKPFHSVPGQTVQITMDGDPFDIYLPQMALSDIQPLDPTDTTTVVFGPTAGDSLEAMFPDVDPTLWDEMELFVEPGAAVDENGNPATTATLVPVPSDRLPGPLPPNVDSELVISIQAPGATNFDVPAAVTFPNINGLPPGSKTAILSFDHDAGEWRVVGPATVSADGRRVVSDPGVGIVAPGWHTLFTMAAILIGGVSDPTNGCETEAAGLLSSGTQCGIAAVTDFLTGGTGGGVASKAVTAASIATDCTLDVVDSGSPSFGCAQSSLLNLTACLPIPYAGTALNCFGAGTALARFLSCESMRPGLAGEKGGVGSIGGTGTVGNFWEDQERIIADSTEIRKQLLGDPVWCALNLEDEELFIDLYEKISQAVADNSPLGTSVTADERQSILAMQKPSAVTTAQLEDLIDRLASLATGDFNGAGIDTVALRSALLSFQATWAELEAKGWVSMTDGFTRYWPILLSGLSARVGGVCVNDKVHYHVSSANFEQRGNLDMGSGGSAINVAPSQSFSVKFARTVVDRDSNGRPASTSYRTATTMVTSGGPGSTTTTPKAVFGAVGSIGVIGALDTDGDGVPDEVEAILGTNPNNPDSDGDGITDEAEILQGLNPLDNISFPLGVVASVEIEGEPLEIIVEGSDNDIFQSTAFVASGSYGLSLLDVTDFSNPVLLGELELPGTATDVVADLRFDRAAVATGVNGIHLVDVSDRMMPSVLTVVPVQASQIEVYKGLLYAGSDFQIFVIDLLTGQILTSIPNVESIGMTRIGSFLFTVGDDHELRCFDVSGFEPVARGTLAIPNAVGPIYAENGILYAVAEGRGGYHTIDISDPDALTLVSASDVASPFVAARDDFAGNGTGRGLLVGTTGLDLMNLDDPNDTIGFLSRVDPGVRVNTVTIARGVAFAGVSDNTVQTVNYLAFDGNGIAPVATLSAPGLSGNQVPEGANIELAINIQEDVQVRNVELLLDDMFVFNDVSAPFDFVIRAPATTFGVNLPFELKVRVTDTGGNVSESNVLSLQSLNDPTPPMLLATSPNTSAAGVDVSSISLFFDRPLESGGMTLGNFTLTNLGADGQSGGGDDTPVGISALTQIDGIRVQLTTGSVLPTGVYLLDGGAFGSVIFRAIVSVPGTVQWIGTSGSWDNPFNWSSGAPPSASDPVVVDVFAQDAVITIPSGSFNANSLLSTEHLDILGDLTIHDTGGTVFDAVSACVRDNGGLTLNGGGTVSGSLLLTSGGTIRAEGAQASFTTMVPVSISDGNVEALMGGSIDLPSASTYFHSSTGSRGIRADGNGSTISLLNLSSILNFGANNSDLAIEATAGGNVLLPAVVSISESPSSDTRNSHISVLADGASSTIDLSGLVEFRDLNLDETSSLSAINGGTILSPDLTLLELVEMDINQTGTIGTESIESVLDGRITFDRNPGTFPVLRDISRTLLEVNQTTVSLPNVTRADGASMVVTSGGDLSVPALTVFSQGATRNNTAVNLRVDGSGSTLNLPNLITIENGEFYNADLTIEAVNGGVIDLSSVLRVVDAERGDLRQHDHTVRADGFGSTIQLDQLRNIHDPSPDGSFVFAALSGGTINAPQLSHAVGVTSTFDALSSTPTGQLLTFTDGSILIDGTTPNLTQLLDLNGTSLEVLGATVNLPNFPTMWGVSYIVRNGGVLNMSGLTNYRHASTGNNQTRTFLAEGAGSQINTPVLATILNGENYAAALDIIARSGGSIDMSVVDQVVGINRVDTRQRAVNLTADGIGSTLDLSALRLLLDLNKDKLSSIQGLNGGTLAAPLLASAAGYNFNSTASSAVPVASLERFVNGHFLVEGQALNLANLEDLRSSLVEVRGSTINFPSVLRADAMNILLDGSGSASFPQLSHYRHTATGNNQTRNWSVTGAGSTLSMPSLADITNGDFYNSNFELISSSGGTIDLPMLVQMVDPNRGDSRLRKMLLEASGAGSTIDVPALLNIIDLNGDALSVVRPNTGGSITYNPATIITQNVTFSTTPLSPRPGGSSEDKIENAGNKSGEPDSVPHIDVPFGPNRTVTWNGGIGNWSVAGNWTPGLPTANDDVMIASGTVIIDADTAAKSINGAGNLQVDTGTLSLWGSSAVSGSLTISPGAGLRLVGQAGAFTGTGSTQADGANLIALNGASISLPTLTSYTHLTDANNLSRLWLAEGIGSHIQCGALTAIRNGENYNSDVRFEARLGGRISLPGLTSITDTTTGDTRVSTIDLIADGDGSLIDLEMLMLIQDNNRDDRSTIAATRGGQILANSLNSMDVVTISIDPDSGFVAPNLSAITDSILTLDDVAFPFPSLQTINRSTVTISRGTHVLNLSNINGSSFFLRQAASLSLPSITSYNHDSDGNSQTRTFLAEAGSVLSFPNLTAISNGEAYGSTIDLIALSGGQVLAPQVQQLIGPSTGDTRQRAFDLRAEGYNSTIDLPILSSLVDQNADKRSSLEAYRGGTINTPMLANIQASEIWLNSHGSLDTEQIVTFTDSFVRGDRVTPIMNSLVTANGTTFEMVAATFEPLNLASVNKANFRALDGAMLTFPAVVNYQHDSTGNSQTRLFEAEGKNSRLEFPNLTSFTNGENYGSRIEVNATAGGFIDFSAMQQIVEPAAGDNREREVNFLADGIGSIIDLTSAVNMIDQNEDEYSTLAGVHGGSILCPILSNLNGTEIIVDGDGTVDTAAISIFTDGHLRLEYSALALPNLTNGDGTHFDAFGSGASLVVPTLNSFDDAWFTAISGGLLEFSGVTSYSQFTTANSQVRTFTAEGGGSRINFPNLTSITGGENYASGIDFSALTGGTLDYPSLLTIRDNAAGDDRLRRFNLLADGVNSQINMPVLAILEDINADQLSSIAEANRGVVNYNAGAVTLTNVTEP